MTRPAANRTANFNRRRSARWKRRHQSERAAAGRHELGLARGLVSVVHGFRLPAAL